MSEFVKIEDKDLSELFREGLQFGKVSITTSDDGRYFASITFHTVSGVTLNVTEWEDSPEKCMREAIATAKQVVEEHAKMHKKITCVK